MRVLGAIILHYGSDYLEYVLKSIYPHVDQILISYTATPTHGSISRMSCPDTEEKLKEIARPFMDKIVWENVRGVIEENVHRNRYLVYGTNARFDQVLVADADEVFEDVPGILAAARETNAYHVGIGGDRWYHFWRTFNEVNRDGFYPIRVHNILAEPKSHAIIHTGKVYHFGYAISDHIMEYKLSCHGHKSEFKHDWLSTWKNYNKTKWDEYIDTQWRRDVDWTLHPVSRQVWIKTELFDKTTLPEFMRSHPKYGL